MMRWCWVNFQCRGFLLIWIRLGQGPTALAVGAGGVVDIFSLVLLILIRLGQGPTALVVGAVGLFGHFFSCLSFLFSVSLSRGDGPI